MRLKYLIFQNTRFQSTAEVETPGLDDSYSIFNATDFYLTAQHQ